MSSIVDHPLLKLPKFGTGIGLHRVRYLLEALGLGADLPERCIVVTGSNGKGSTAKIASELLRYDGADVGLFTSPHLYRYNERFQINGVAISDTDLSAAMDEVLGAVERYQRAHADSVGAFEAHFAVALMHFRRLRWMVLEAGIGGRYDPVRLARAPITGLVSLDLEHTELLGNTLAEIAFDKLDATRPGGLAVLGESLRGIEREITSYAALTDTRLQFLDPSGWQDLGIRDGRQRFGIRDPDIVLPDLDSDLIGRHQINNHAMAVRLCVERLKLSGLWPCPGLADAWRRALATVTWPGRLERIGDDPPIVIDVGHSPEAVCAALGAYLASAPREKSILVTGVSKNKAAKEIVEILAPSFDRIVCTAAHHNGSDPKAISAIAATANPDAKITVSPTIAEAAQAAMREARAANAAIYVAGGLFLAAEFAEFCRGGAPEKMRFF